MGSIGIPSPASISMNDDGGMVWSEKLPNVYCGLGFRLAAGEFLREGADHLTTAREREREREGRSAGSTMGTGLDLPLCRRLSVPNQLQTVVGSPEPEDGRRAAKEGAGGGEVGFPVENEYPSEGNGGREVESDEYVEELDEKDDDEDYEVDEPESVSEQDAVALSTEDWPKLDDGFYEIEAIQKKRIIKEEPQYFIKWHGWPESSNTWELLEHLNSCPNVVEAFEKSLNSGKKARKRKGKYTHSKKMLQKSYASSSSRDGWSSRVEKRALESVPSYDPSHTSGSKETAGNDNSIDKDDAQMEVTIQLEEVAKADGSGSIEANQSERRIGAKRRKSSNVQ